MIQQHLTPHQVEALLREHYERCGYIESEVSRLTAYTIFAIPLIRGGCISITCDDGRIGWLHASANGFLCTKERGQAILGAAGILGCEFVATEITCEGERQREIVRRFLGMNGFTEDERGIFWIRTLKPYQTSYPLAALQ